MAVNPTGEQWTIARDGHEATVVEVGGGLRSYVVDGTPVVAGFAAGQECDAGRGQVLMPWPNRIRDGRWSHGGRHLQLPLSDVTGGNASHGLVRWSTWTLLDRTAHEVVVGYRLHPSPGWPGHLDCRMTYSLNGSGLVVTAWVRNIGEETMPFGYGAHPYLALGDTPADEVELTLPAATVVEVDERALPTGERHPAGDLDFREPKLLGETTLDTPYTDVVRGADGRWVASVRTPEATRILWGGEGFDWLQAFTGRARDGRGSPRGIAIEPMTCPADSFNSGDGLLLLKPGGEWSAQWGCGLV